MYKNKKILMILCIVAILFLITSFLLAIIFTKEGHVKLLVVLDRMGKQKVVGPKFILIFNGLEFKEIEEVSDKEKRSNFADKIEFEKAKVLVVDDIESNRKFLKIKREPFRV